MAKKYKQKNLGYDRQSTDAKMRVTFSNGDVFDVPLQIIADDRDEHYQDEQEDTIAFVADDSLDEYELTDWFKNNMNWSDIADYAVKVETEREDFDYDAEFGDAECSVQGDI